jgi:branched-chain amino acid aminotransferase
MVKMVEAHQQVMYFNGRMMPHSQAVTELQGRDVQSVGGLYDTERTFNGRLFKLAEHLERLYRGLEVAGIDAGMSLQAMETASQDVLEANRPMLGTDREFTVTQIVSLSRSGTPDAQRGVNVAIYCQPLDYSEFAEGYSNGVRLVTPVTYNVPELDEQLRGKLGFRRVVPLLSNAEGDITECSGANFMFVRDGRIKLPDRSNVLPGISMQTVLELADAAGISVDEDDYSTYHAYLADEAFISSTLRERLP